MKTLVVALALGVTACGGNETAEEPGNNLAAPADVDVLPPDESVATPTGELANGVTNTADDTEENAVE